jgi:hypothetical protein
VAGLAEVGLGTAQAVEAGKVCLLETYMRLAAALRLKAEFEFVDPRRREPLTRRAADLVHVAMGEAEAAHLRGLGFAVGIDEPFQHYGFSGRADVVAWSVERAALLHIENRTRFPDIQESFGSFNTKRRYLGREVAGRVGVARWRSETHVMAALWSAEVLRPLRLYRASFESVCPDPPDEFEAWWRGGPPTTGRHSILLIFDPVAGNRRDRRQWAGFAELPDLRPRYRDYADAVAVIRRVSPDRAWQPQAH